MTKKEDRWRKIERTERNREGLERQQRETDGGREEADRNSMGAQHWRSQRGTAGSMASRKMSAEQGGGGWREAEQSGEEDPFQKFRTNFTLMENTQR